MEKYPMSKRVIVTLVGLLLFSAPTVQSQQRQTLDVMLSDANYVFNRYDELSSGALCDSWKASDSLKRTCKDELRLIASNVQSTKPVLSRAAGSKSPELIDLFDVLVELNEVAGHLMELSNNVSDFGGVDGTPYAQAGAKALILSAQLGNEIKIRLATQQARLLRCGAEK
jgi:hypothetical protein